MESPKPIRVREVWAHNLQYEINLIANLLPSFEIVSFDTEFPGTVIDFGLPRHAKLDSTQSYDLMQCNVNSTEIIQLGLSISTADGALPDLGTDYSFIWQFNFRDFDIDTHIHAPDSIELLKKQGIDFEKNREHGVDSSAFARLALQSGLFSSKWLTWATFHGSSDFGYLIKIITQKNLPSDFNKFMLLFGYFFGSNVFDIKHMIRSCDGLYGGLERVAAALGVARVAGNGHQAGSDSLLTLQTFLKLKKECFMGKEGSAKLEGMKCFLHSLNLLTVDEGFRYPGRGNKVVPLPYRYGGYLVPKIVPRPVIQAPIGTMIRDGVYCYGYC